MAAAVEAERAEQYAAASISLWVGQAVVVEAQLQEHAPTRNCQAGAGSFLRLSRSRSIPRRANTGSQSEQKLLRLGCLASELPNHSKHKVYTSKLSCPSGQV